MGENTKQTATALYTELNEVLAAIPGQIEKADDNGPVLGIICAGLAKALSELRTTVR